MKRRRAIDLDDLTVAPGPTASPEPVATPDQDSFDQDVVNALPTKVQDDIDFGEEIRDDSGLPDPVAMVRQAIAADLDS